MPSLWKGAATTQPQRIAAGDLGLLSPGLGFLICRMGMMVTALPPGVLGSIP